MLVPLWANINFIDVWLTAFLFLSAKTLHNDNTNACGHASAHEFVLKTFATSVLAQDVAIFFWLTSTKAYKNKVTIATKGISMHFRWEFVSIITSAKVNQPQHNDPFYVFRDPGSWLSKVESERALSCGLTLRAGMFEYIQQHAYVACLSGSAYIIVYMYMLAVSRVLSWEILKKTWDTSYEYLFHWCVVAMGLDVPFQNNNLLTWRSQNIIKAGNLLWGDICLCAGSSSAHKTLDTLWEPNSDSNVMGSPQAC